MPNTTTKTEAKTEAKLTARAAAIAEHDKAGFTGSAYRGISKTRNSATVATIDCGTSKASKRTYAQLTERMHATLTEIAANYKAGSFLARGIDRGQAAIFINSGIMLRDGTSGDVAGNIYSDGKTPLKLKLSADALKRYS